MEIRIRAEIVKPGLKIPILGKIFQGISQILLTFAKITLFFSMVITFSDKLNKS